MINLKIFAWIEKFKKILHLVNIIIKVIIIYLANDLKKELFHS